MQIIPFSSILIAPNRQRQEFDPDSLMELTTSIESKGLLQAPVLRSTPEGLTLVAGERRLRAISDLWALGMRLIYDGQVVEEGFIPYTLLGDLSELEIEEAELDENLKRRDLTFLEEAAAHKRLHILRDKQMELARGSDESLDSWTIADTAKEIHGRSDGAYQEKVRRQIIVADHLDNPEVQSAKSLDDAYKILKREETTARNIALAEEVGKTFSSDTHTLLNANCLDYLTAQPFPGSIDVILTDPPYGMGADTFGDGAGKLSNIEHHYSDTYENWKTLMTTWCPLSYLICKPQAHAYVFCDFDRFHELKSMMQSAGWYVFRTPLIHYKPNSGRVPLPDQGPRRQYELILYAIKGKKPITHIYPDVIPTQADKQEAHGAQKPVDLFKNLLQRSVLPGDVVLDCFAGTGPIIPACHSFKCKAIAIEQSKESFAKCVQRVKELETAND